MKKLDKKDWGMKSYIPLFLVIVVLLIGGVSLFGGGNRITMLEGASNSLAGITPTFKSIPSLSEGGKALFDVTLSIPEDYKNLPVGEPLMLSLELTNFGKEKTRVEVTYIITRINGGEIVYIEHEGRTVETQSQFLKILDLQQLPLGEYRVYAHLLYEGNTATATETFRVGLN